jgi:hypothetical protein
MAEGGATEPYGARVSPSRSRRSDDGWNATLPSASVKHTGGLRRWHLKAATLGKSPATSIALMRSGSCAWPECASMSSCSEPLPAARARPSEDAPPRSRKPESCSTCSVALPMTADECDEQCVYVQPHSSERHSVRAS